MAHLEIWKLAVDVLLMASLCVLCVRLLKSGASANRNPRALELEGSLRALIREADDAGRTLNDELARRQRDLDRLLRDIQGAESTVRRAISQVHESERLAGQLGPTPLTNRVEVSVEPPSFAAQPPVAARARPEAPKTPTARAQRVNIYGEPISDSAPAPRREQVRPPVAAAPAVAAPTFQAQAAIRPQPVTSPLVAAVEQSVEPAAVSQPVDDIYRAAEDLLRAGKDLAFVAATTRLPMDEVKVLSRVVSQQIIAKSSAGIVAERVISPETPQVKSADPRLGVFGSIKRQVQTL